LLLKSIYLSAPTDTQALENARREYHNSKKNAKDWEEFVDIHGYYDDNFEEIYEAISIGSVALRNSKGNLNANPISIEELKQQQMVFEINECFVVEGVGLVVSGIVRSGVVNVNDLCRLGPDKFKNFKNVQVK
jgi:hypothetical protein